jgi:DMSO/TMAO reductase YedYZ molybdopterin-dependent catalytic subunit
LAILALVAALRGADNQVLLTVEGSVKTPLALSADDLAKMPRNTATLERDGEAATYDGVLLYDILVKAGVRFGRAMTGKPMASYILATARDGYQVVFALPEIDPEFMGARVLIADKRNGGPLLGPQQPLQMIAPQDKLHARSMYSLTKIEIVRLRP